MMETALIALLESDLPVYAVLLIVFAVAGVWIYRSINNNVMKIVTENNASTSKLIEQQNENMTALITAITNANEKARSDDNQLLGRMVEYTGELNESIKSLQQMSKTIEETRRDDHRDNVEVLTRIQNNVSVQGQHIGKLTDTQNLQMKTLTEAVNALDSSMNKLPEILIKQIQNELVPKLIRVCEQALAPPTEVPPPAKATTPTH